MLYPKSHEPLTLERFRNPGCEYRATPFWAWNNRLDAHELCWQIEQLKKMGFGGFHMHVRTGMATEYLSDEYMGIIRQCVDKAEQEDMLAWLYDEDRWPSGAAGGLVTRQRRFRQCFLVFSRERLPQDAPLAVFDVSLNPDGTLRGYRPIREGEPVEGFALYATVQLAGDDPWFNNQAYLNTLDPESVQAFLHTTHDRYYESVGDRFGGRIPAIFTDEPQFSRKETLSFAFDTRPVTLPWTHDFPETFRAAYDQDVTAMLPELLWDLPEGKASTLRYHYHDHVAERFAQAFADQCGQWCRAHGIALTGHMMQEPTLESQTGSLGDTMRSYRAFDIPGIDMLCDRREFTTAKQAQSAARQYGREGMTSELYGVTNWDFDFRGHKLQGDWQAALGVTVRVPHLSWVSMNGEAKRDYPGTFNYQAPWYQEYGVIEDHFARVATALTRGKALCRVGVIHPVESYWLHWGARENTAAIRDQMDKRFRALTEWLLRGLMDFDFLCESLLPEQTAVDAIVGSGFPVGAMRYDVIVVPPLETIRSTTLERLKRYHEMGGRVIFLEKAPTLMDAVPSDEPQNLYNECEQCTFDQVTLLSRLSNLREIEVRDASGAAMDSLLYQMREEEGSRWLFLCHAEGPANPDIPSHERLTIRLRGQWALTHYDTLTGDIASLPARHVQGWTVFQRDFYDHDSLLLRMEPVQEVSSASVTKEEEKPAPVFQARFLDAVPVTLSEPNVLLLDLAEYALDDQPMRPMEEILRLDNLLRGELGWPGRGEKVAQPWVEQDRSTPHILRLRYRFDSEVTVTGASLAIENAALCRIALDGQPAQPPEGWYTDRCIGRCALPVITPGKHVLEVSMPYGRSIDVEAAYLLGDFGVQVSGVHGTLTAPVRSLTFGDVTRQGLPFYGGNITYHLTCELNPGTYQLAVSQYRGHLMRLAVDGEDAGPIVFSPYQACFRVDRPGAHRLDLTLFGCRINTFGQVHQVNKQLRWWGPESWRSQGAGWAYEYQLWPQGILKSPELFTTEKA